MYLKFETWYIQEYYCHVSCKCVRTSHWEEKKKMNGKPLLWCWNLNPNSRSTKFSYQSFYICLRQTFCGVGTRQWKRSILFFSEHVGKRLSKHHICHNKNQMYLNKWLNVFGNQTMDEIYNGTRLNKHNIWPNSLMYLS